VPQNAWADRMVDVSDVVHTQKDAYHPTVYLATQYYNNVAKKRSIYIVPYKTAVVPFHIWNSLVEKAGFKLSDAPKTWDAFWDFFKPMQAKLRNTGMRNIYALGMQCTTTGPNDGNNLFNHFLITNGGNGIVTKDGKVHLDDPQVKEAAIKAITSHYQDLQGRRRSARRIELERRRRQQRLSLETVRHGFRRHDLDRGRDQAETRAARLGQCPNEPRSESR
jgi:ABC-type glycerol-3-phosphate transport system substrate-binding protein